MKKPSKQAINRLQIFPELNDFNLKTGQNSRFKVINVSNVMSELSTHFTVYNIKSAILGNPDIICYKFDNLYLFMLTQIL